MQKIKSLARFILGVPLTIASLLFVLNFIYSSRLQVLPLLKNFDPIPLTVGMLFLGLFFLFRSLLWKEILKQEGFNPTTIESTYLLASSELKRYIPGSVLAIAGRVHNFGKLKIGNSTVLRMIIYESILFLITSTLLSIPAGLFLLSKYSVNSSIFILAIVIFVGLFSLGLIIAKKKIKTLFKVLPNYSTAFFLMCAAWIAFGLGSFLIMTSFYGINPQNISLISSILILSWLVGYVVIIAPLGLGVREAFMTYALSFFTPIGIAASLAIITRVAFTLSELIFCALSYFLYKNTKLRLKVETHTVILWSLIISYITYFTYVSFQKYTNFFTGRFDLGNMDQTVWNTLHGRIFQLTDPDGINTVSRLAFHSDFMLALLAPFYILWEDPRMLLLIQTVAIGMGAFFVYKIAEKILNHKNASLFFAAAYLLNPFVQKQNLFDFHAVTLATTLLLAAFYFILKKEYKWMLVATLLAALTKEEVFVVAGLIFAYTGIRTKNKWWYVASLASFAAFYELVQTLIPLARGGQHFATEYFQDFGDTPSEIIKNIAFNPSLTASSLLTKSNFNYLFELFLPVGFLSIFSPLQLILGAPDLGINLLSKNENFKSLTFHYAATIIPFIYISAVYGAERLLKFKKKVVNIKTVSSFVLISSFVSTYFYGTIPGSLHPSLEIYNQKVANSTEIENFLSHIPANLSVSASNNLGSHLSHRENIYTIPNGIDSADVIVLLLNDSFAQPSLSSQKDLANRLRHDPHYVDLYESGDFVAFAKKDAAKYIQTDIKSTFD